MNVFFQGLMKRFVELGYAVTVVPEDMRHFECLTVRLNNKKIALWFGNDSKNERSLVVRMSVDGEHVDFKVLDLMLPETDVVKYCLKWLRKKT